MIPNLQIIGVQKSGTSALAHFLSQHPDICLVENKEAHVFDDPDYLSSDNPTAFANEKYKKRFAHYQDEAILCDATPITIFRPEYLSACYNYNPNAKFIVLLRDPTERAISQYRMSVRMGVEPLPMLKAFITENKRIQRTRETDGSDFDAAFRNHSYLQRGLYSLQLTNLYKTVPASQVLILHQQELAEEHQKTLNKVFQFICVEPTNVSAERVFEGEPQTLKLTERFAQLYARLYFLFKGESPSRWHKITCQNKKMSISGL